MLLGCGAVVVVKSMPRSPCASGLAYALTQGEQLYLLAVPHISLVRTCSSASAGVCVGLSRLLNTPYGFPAFDISTTPYYSPSPPPPPHTSRPPCRGIFGSSAPCPAPDH